jgi:hypothetical protein
VKGKTSCRKTKNNKKQLISEEGSIGRGKKHPFGK